MRSAPGQRSLLVISHPGHELRLYGWIDQVRPLVCILTDGSGGDSTPRLGKTLDILHSLGAETGPVCGELSDRRIYEEIHRHRLDLFDMLCERLANLIIFRDIDTVVSDAMEGYNPTHDLCEVMVRAAVAVANGKRNRTTRHYTFPLMGDPCKPPMNGRIGGHGVQAAPRATWRTVELTPPKFKCKLEMMRSYADNAGGKLREEVEDAFRTYGEYAFAREYLFAAPESRQALKPDFAQAKPFYETYGEKQVAGGRYSSVIRFREHILPLVNHLYAKMPAATAALAVHAGIAEL
jgi:hypothetical protein